MRDALLETTLDRLRNLGDLYPPTTLARATEGWLDRQLARCADPAFAARFTDHHRLAGVAAADYLHRVVEVDGGRVLGGVRFYGGDTRRPFVDVLAWDRAPAWDRLRAAVAREWRAFQPRDLRVLVERLPEAAGARVDQHVHAARVEDMIGAAGAPEELGLRPGEPEAVAALVRRCYEGLAPGVAAEVAPADAAQLRACLAGGGRVDVIEVDGEAAGVLAVEPGAVEMLPGWVVLEEAILPGFRGRGLASQAQRRLAQLLAADDPDAVVLGTIHARNLASRRTAARAGRPARRVYAFLPLR